METRIMISCDGAEDSEVTGSAFIVGRGEDRYLESGWLDREIHLPTQVPFRPAMPEACFRLLRRPGQDRLKILLLPPVIYLGRGYRGEVLADGAPVGVIEAEEEVWRLCVFDLPPLAEPRAVDFRLLSHSIVIPARDIPGSRESQPIGCFVAGARLESPGGRVDIPGESS